jgi:ABC-type transport system involved in cytochrome c biogenesis permease subunit
VGIAALLLLARNIYAIGGSPPEATQGAIFKIIFFCVPAAMTGIVAATVAMIMSVMFLVTKHFKYDAGVVAVTDRR